MLKEFDLDGPSLQKTERQSFRYQTRSTTALYERMFKPVSQNPVPKKLWKVLVEVVPVITKPSVRDLLGVLTVQTEGDPRQLLEADRAIKPGIALDWLDRGITKIVTEMNWPPQFFAEARAAVIALDFKNKWQWKTKIWNQDNTAFCDIEIEHSVDEARIVASFKSPSGNIIGDRILCTTPPTEFAFVPCLGVVEWLDEKHLRLVSKIRDQKWLTTIPDYKGD